MEELLRKFLFGGESKIPLKNEKTLEIVRVLIIKKLEREKFSNLKSDLNFG